jgi:hypothetical protein
MPANEAHHLSESEEPSGQSSARRERIRASKRVTEARALAQRVKLDAQAEARQEPASKGDAHQRRGGKHTQRGLQANRRAHTTVARGIEDYLLDQEGGNHSAKTLEWHRTALGLMRTYFEEDRGITLVGEIEAADINAWFAHMRKSSVDTANRCAGYL